jgi:cytochrome c556
MRIAMFAFAAPLVLLAACGGPESSQANNAQANIGNDASPPPTANSTNSMVLLAVPKEKLLKVMHERHEGMETIGKNFKVLRRELTGSSPDLGAVRSSSATVTKLASNASGWFPQGTGPELGKTGAKPEIWQNRQDFATKLRNFQSAANAFHIAASANDVGVTKDRFADLGGTCKACHDKYRSEMHH